MACPGDEVDRTPGAGATAAMTQGATLLSGWLEDTRTALPCSAGYNRAELSLREVFTD